MMNLRMFLEYPEDKAICHALNTIVHTGLDNPEVRNAVACLYPKKQYKYSLRIVEWLSEKWNLDLN